MTGDHFKRFNEEYRVDCESCGSEVVMIKIIFLKSDMNCCEQCCHNKGYCTRASIFKPVIGQCWFEEEY